MALRRLLSRLLGSVAHRMGFKVLGQHEFLELARTAEDRGHRIAALQEQIESAQSELSALSSSVQSYRAQEPELAAARAQITRLTGSVVNLSNTLSRLSREKSARPRTRTEQQGDRATIAVVTTEISQLPHLRSLLSLPEITSRFGLVVFSNIPDNVDSTGLVAFCSEREISLFRDFNVVGSQEQAAGSASNPFSGPLDLRTMPTEQQDKLRLVDDLLKEINARQDFCRDCQSILRRMAASVLVLFEDNAMLDSGLWVSAAKTLSIPIVIAPVTIADEREPAENLMTNSWCWANTHPLDPIVAQRFPRWNYFHKGRLLRRRPTNSLLAVEALGVAQPNPWIINSSHADAIIVESQAMMKHYERVGIPAAQLELTGGLVDDTIHRAARDRIRIRKELGADASKPVLLCGFPPNSVDHLPDCEFPTYRELITFWLEALLATEGWHVVVKPHPAIRLQDVEYMRSFGLTVSTQDSTVLIPACDVYVTSISSTIRWALASGKPVLNYDVYRLNYTEYDDEPAVKTVANRDDFLSALGRLSSDLEDTTRMARERSGHWGMLDGGSGRRLAQLFASLLEAD